MMGVVNLVESDFNITVVGLGLIGGSYAMALRELNPRNLWGIDINKNTIRIAEEQGIIDKGYVNPEIPLRKSDIVIICLYPDLTIKFMKDNMNLFKSKAIITDTAGIKDKIVKEINTFIREDIEFIGGHPMAGRECGGLAFASKDIFSGANYIITPTRRNKAKNIELIEDIIKKIGCKKIVKISPKKHDEVIAFTSQLPHILAVSLVSSDIEEDVGSFIGGSFKDATRVAMINSELWTELLIDNSNNIINQIKVFEDNIANIKRAIINSDSSFLKSTFEKVRLKREELK
jgi:prephenate dehydrogenase